MKEVESWINLITLNYRSSCYFIIVNLIAAENSHIYHLSSVLEHRGQSTNCGHYVALVKDATIGAFYIMNDSCVTRNSGDEFAGQ